MNQLITIAILFCLSFMIGLLQTPTVFKLNDKAAVALKLKQRDALDQNHYQLPKQICLIENVSKICYLLKTHQKELSNFYSF